MRPVRSTVLAGLLCCASVSARAQESPPAASVDSVHGVRIERRSRVALAITGGALFGAGYVLSFLVALTGGFGGISPVVLIPVAGPWIGFGWDTAGASRCPLDVQGADCSAFNPDVAMAVAGGLELVGATMFGAGLVRHDVKRPVRVVPSLSLNGGLRLGLRVSF